MADDSVIGFLKLDIGRNRILCVPCAELIWGKWYCDQMVSMHPDYPWVITHKTLRDMMKTDYFDCPHCGKRITSELHSSD